MGTEHQPTQTGDPYHHLRLLTQRLITLQERERLRISHGLHEEIGQALTALMINLVMLRGEINTTESAAFKRIEIAIDLVQESIDGIRNLARDLRPPALDTLGLNLTLAGYCQEMEQRFHIPIDYQGTEISSLDSELSITLYRFLQESLTNVHRHAQADRVCVRLEQVGNLLCLTVEDNGLGMNPQQIFSGSDDRIPPNKPLPLGLLGMKERFDLLGGDVQIISQPGHGTRLIGRLPL